MTEAFNARRTQELEHFRAYHASKLGRRFSITHQTPSTDITGGTSFSATAPDFILYGASVARRAVISSMMLSQSGTVAGATVFYTIAIDTANRYSSGGTLVTPQNMSGDSSNTSVWTFRTGATATAAGAGTRYLGTFSAPATLGILTSIDCGDGVLLGTGASGVFTGSLLIYAWAGTTGPSLKFQLEYLEES